MVQKERADSGHHRDADNRERDAEHAAEIDRPGGVLQIGGMERDRAALRQPGGEAPKDAHRAERRDERLDAAPGHDEAVEETAGAADDDRKRRGGEQEGDGAREPAGVEEQDQEAGDERDHRADGQVEAARGDHEGRAHCDGGDEGALRRDVQQVAERQEAIARQRAEHHQEQERRERRHRAKVDPRPRAHGAGRIGPLRDASCTHATSPREVILAAARAFAPVASTTISVSVMCSPATSPTI